MSERKFYIRRMLPAEAAEVAELHLQSFPGYFLSQLGRRFLTLYYRELCQDPSGIAFVCYDETKLVAFAVGMMNPSGFYRRLFKRRWFAFMLAALLPALRHPKFIPRLLRTPGYAGTVPGGDDFAILSSIAVIPQVRGTGVGTQLMAGFVNAVQQRGGKEIMWGAKKREEATNRFYRKFGFSEVREVRDSTGEEIVEYFLKV